MMGLLLASDTGSGSVYTEEGLADYAARILNSGKISGTQGSMLFLVREKDGYTLVAFMDNTIIQESMTALFLCASAKSGPPA